MLPTHTSWATLHSHNKCRAVSLVLLHSSQLLSSTTCFLNMLSRVGRIPWQAHYPNTFILLGMCICHNLPHTNSPAPAIELSACILTSLMILHATLYPDLTEYIPSLLKSQKRELATYLLLSGILSIASASSLWNFHLYQVSIPCTNILVNKFHHPPFPLYLLWLVDHHITRVIRYPLICHDPNVRSSSHPSTTTSF